MLFPVSTTQGNSTQGDSTHGVEDMVKDFVATRPRRPRQGRIVAGVAAGLGRRYGIDPVIIRVALVVSAFYGGAGMILYLLGWLFLPAEDDEVSGVEGLLGRGRTSMSRGFALVLCIALIPSAEFVFGGHYSTLAGLVLLLGGLFLLHRYRADQGIVTGAPGTAATGTDSEVGPMTDSTPTSAIHDDDETNPAGPQDRVPPAWDPLGAAPFAWDLPEPGPSPAATPPVVTPEPVRRRRSRIGLATFGLALVVGAVLFGVAPHDSWLDAPHIVGIIGAVLGIGLVAGAFVRGGRGLIPLAVIVSGVGFLMTSAHLTDWHGVGDARFEPTTIANVRPVYEQSVGTMRLDLTGLPNSGTVHTQLKLGLGDVTVDVQANAEVTATCSATIGDVTCLGERESGANNPTVTAHQDATGTGDHLTIVLNVHGGTGSVRVINDDDVTANPRPVNPPNAPNAPVAPTH